MTGITAVIADVHGNRWALDAVVDDARRHGATRFVNLGDCVHGPLDPRGTLERLVELQAATVRGNQDIVDGSETGRFVRDRLEPAQLDWLAGLPPTLRLDGLLLCHGTPVSDTEYLLEEVGEQGARHRAPAAVERALAGVDADVVLCAHTHVPRALALRRGRLLVLNPGSVGLPAYDDDRPHPHVMESGSPHARYALLERRDGGWRSELRAIEYPWHRAASAARERGREDWAVALETGLALPSTR